MTESPWSHMSTPALTLATRRRCFDVRVRIHLPAHIIWTYVPCTHVRQELVGYFGEHLFGQPRLRRDQRVGTLCEVAAHTG
jgi:hypothetical protein